MKTPEHKTTNQHIWLLLDSRSPGGIESHILQLAVGLLNHNESVTVVFLTDYGDHPLRGALHKYGIATTSLDGRISTLWQAIRKARPSVIHTHGYKAGIVGRIVARLCNVPVASTYHAGETTSGWLGFYCWLDRISATLADKIFAVSPQIAATLPGTTQVTDNFIDTHDLPHTLTTSTQNQIAFVGRLSEEKGPDHYLSLANRFPQLEFHLYGDGPLAIELQTSAPENTYFHGQQDDMTPIWPKIGLLVMPSRHEGLPMAALEAMARGIPVLASDVGALDQLIDSGSNGWLVKPGDEADLANCLQRWTGMGDEQRQHFKQAARQKIDQRFSADVVIPKLINCYRLIAS